MLQGSRSRLLAYYLLVMATILCLFSIALFVLFSRSLHHQLDTNLQTLAQVAAPSFIEIRNKDSQYLQRVDEFPWQGIFKPEQQSLEWFDDEGKLLGSKGNLKLYFSPRNGFWTLKKTASQNTYDIRTFTLPIFINRSSLNLPVLRGYVRSSQSTEDPQQVKQQFLWQLGISILMALVVVAVGGVWLTKKALEPVEYSFNQLKQFTADASHELRSPLTAIKTSLDVMKNHPERFEEKDIKKLSAISSATQQMTHLTQDLLFLARTEGTRTNTEVEWYSVPLHHLLEDIFDLLEPVAQDKQVTLEYQCLAKLRLIGDPSQLNRLFANLLENAIQYTPPEGRVILRLIKQNNSAVVSVEDTGIGIAPENLSQVFNRFWRADQARVFRQGGTGLGLAIAQAIANRHGGQITVSSQVGVGSCFQVFLPIHKADFQKTVYPWSLERVLKSLQRLKRNQPIHLFKKLALILLAIILGILPLFLVKEVFIQTQTFQNIQFPNGAASFADEVVAYQSINVLAQEQSSNPQKTLSNPSAALGIPNSALLKFPFFSKKHQDIVLKKGDYLTLKFTNNLLTGSDNSKNDLKVFLVGEPKTSLLVEISKDGSAWHRLNWIDHDRSEIDLDRFGWGSQDFFSYIRLTSLPPNNENISFRQTISIDAVGAISTVLLTSSATSFLILENPLVKFLLLIGLVFAISYSISYWLKKKS